MRACEGCRRRKIKCDAATTNAWPCAACVRLKLQCIPPTVNYDRTHSAGGHVNGLERVLDFDNSSGGSGDEDYSQGPIIQNIYHIGSGPELMSSSHPPYAHSLGSSYPPSYTDRSDSQLSHHHMHYENVTSVPLPTSKASYHSQSSFHTSNIIPMDIPENSEPWTHDNMSAAGLSEALGELMIDETGVGKSSTMVVLDQLTIAKRHISPSRRRLLPKHRPSKSMK